MKIKLAILTALFVWGLILPSSSQAITSDFSVRVGQPKTPTNQNYFKLTFVALDTRNDRNITVKCFKKGPSDSGYSQFDVNKIMIPGGNTDYCDVSSGLLNSTGSYSFYVTAEASSTVITSSTVSVVYNTTGPSTPVSYSKDKINNCDYKIKFKTADDSKTIKVQLFRSETQSISIGSGSLVATLNIAPNTEGEITNSTPICGKEYFYALRSVDSSDNVSGTVGDSYTTTTTSTSETVSGAGTIAGTGAIAVSGATSAVALQEGADANTNSATGSADGAGTTSEIVVTPSPEVLGTATESDSKLYKWLFGMTAFIVGIILLKSSGKKKAK